MTKEQIIKEHYRKIASQGGRALLEKYGTEYFRKIRKVGWKKQKMREKAEKDLTA